MLNTLFHYPHVLDRHCKGPAAEERKLFLAHCASGGSPNSTLLRLASELLLIARRIDLDGNPTITYEEIEITADRWVADQQQHHRIESARYSRERFIRTATAWLRFLGRLQEPEEKTSPFANLIHDFEHYSREERGLSPRTVSNRCWHVQTFLRWLSAQGCDLGDLPLEQVDAFIALKRTEGWCRVTMATAVRALRSFFHYAGEQGWCAASLAAGIEGPRLFSQETLPVGPKWEDVQQLIASTDSDRPQDIRDRAV